MPGLKMLGPAVGAGKKVATGRTFKPGSPGFGGRYEAGDTSSAADAAHRLYGTSPKAEWRTALGRHNDRRAYAGAMDRSERGLALAAGGVVASGAAAGAGIGLAARAEAKSKARKRKRPVAKLDDPHFRYDAPGLLHATADKKGVHRVTAMGGFEHQPTKLARAGRFLEHHPAGNATMATAITGAVFGGLAATMPHKKIKPRKVSKGLRFPSSAKAQTGRAMASGRKIPARSISPDDVVERERRQEELTEHLMRPVRKADRKADRQHSTGAAMTGSGAVVGTTGFAAGGLPGVREPNSHALSELSGDTVRQKVQPRNAVRNARKVVPVGRAGILGYRADAHASYMAKEKVKTHGSAYAQAHRAGKMEAEDKILPALRMARRGSHALTLGGAGLAALGIHRMGQESVRKSRQADNVSSGALAGGATLGAVGHYVPKGLRRLERKFETSATDHLQAAHVLAPHVGGAKPKGDFQPPTGRRSAKPSMHPQFEDHDLAWRKAGDGRRFKGGVETAQQVARHRGIAAQERHFAEAFRDTASGIRRLRGPGLAAAGAGAAGLAASHSTKGQRISKAVSFGYQEKQINPRRAAEAGGGAVLLGWGAPRLRSVNAKAGMLAQRGEEHLGWNQKQSETAYGLITRTARATKKATQPVGPFLRQSSHVGHLIDAVPKRLRPIVSVAGGGALIVHATPVRQKTFIRTGGSR